MQGRHGDRDAEEVLDATYLAVEVSETIVVMYEEDIGQVAKVPLGLHMVHNRPEWEPLALPFDPAAGYTLVLLLVLAKPLHQIDGHHGHRYGDDNQSERDDHDDRSHSQQRVGLMDDPLEQLRVRRLGVMGWSRERHSHRCRLATRPS